MKVVVIGGSGLIGSKLVARLRHGGHDVVAASPSSGVNTVSGDGLPEAMEEAEVVVDVANSPSFDDAVAWDFFTASGRNIFAAETAARVSHHIALSVVGTDRLLDSGYFRAKLLQEDLVRKSGIPYTILRSTQFFEFMGGIAGSNTEGQVVRMPLALIQPVAADDVAETLAQISVRAPVNDMVELAGPEPFRFTDIVSRVLAANHDERLVIADPDARYFGVPIEERTLIPGENPRIAPTSLEAWLSRTQFRAA
ncbi:SDR family oxidoreductase [Devosia nitrariae]|uniref:NmrA family transcriptional regulator n=1 Tax=Devosia nitrariae TaxID=2071872 RepID=A0ABQ5WBA8_9HYPH|nr:NAD(P)H-binding protein [Devosia nitrariae]GLQ57071.1 NmrA family transcriptional regulator [Devosia nitrariae]